MQPEKPTVGVAERNKEGIEIENKQAIIMRKKDILQVNTIDNKHHIFINACKVLI